VQPNPRLRFGDAADRWLAEQVASLRPATRAIYRNAVVNHLSPRWERRRLDAIGVDDAAKLVRELRTPGLLRFAASDRSLILVESFRYRGRAGLFEGAHRRGRRGVLRSSRRSSRWAPSRRNCGGEPLVLLP
jgi:hypothetical protein